MKRKIAAVLMSDVVGKAEAGDGAAVRRRVGAGRAVARDAIVRGGGRILADAEDAALLAEFPSAVEAVRTAVDAQETLRSRNKPLPDDERLGFRFGLTIADVPDGEGEVPEETREAASRMLALAAPGGICISRSVREAASGKLNLNLPGLTVEGIPAEREAKRHAGGRPPAPSPLSFARLRWPLAALGAGGIAALAAVLAPRTAPPPQNGNGDKPAATTFLPADPEASKAAVDPAEVKKAVSKESGGALEFKPAIAPDPADVLTARRMMPKAWKDCHDGKADSALRGCNTLIDSGIAKGEELADILLAQARAERDRKQLDKALESLTASIKAAPSPAAYSLRGTVYYDKEKWEEAIADYTETIKRDPGNGEAFNNRAWTYYRIGRADKALADAEAAVRLLGKEAYVWDTRGHIHAELGHRDAAISDFRAALAIDPGNMDSKAGLSRLGVN